MLHRSQLFFEMLLMDLALLLMGAANASFIVPRHQSYQPQDNYSIVLELSQGGYFRKLNVFYFRHSAPSQTSRDGTLLQGSLRDMLNDGSNNASKSNLNSHINTVEQRKKLMKQLQNLSTHEIKRELEQTYGISTSSLREKDQLATALAMARLTGSLVELTPPFKDTFEESTTRQSDKGSSGKGSLPDSFFIESSHTMGEAEIIQQFKLLGFQPDLLSGKKELLEVLMQLQKLQGTSTPLKHQITDTVVAPASDSSSRFLSIESFSDEEGNESIRTPSRMAELTKLNLLPQQPNDGEHSTLTSIMESSNGATQRETTIPFPSSVTPSENLKQQRDLEKTQFQTQQSGFDDLLHPEPQEQIHDRAKLRQLQIAFEFERVQSSLPSPLDIQAELETKFNIDTKYFLGIKEMAYALAVARVDNAINRRKQRGNGKYDDGCIVGKENGIPISKNKNVNIDGPNNSVDRHVINKNDPNSNDFSECLEEGSGLYPPSREDLIAMEYERLQSLDEYELSWELEAQYGVPAKHFLGKKEMAYALAVERVDQAEKESNNIAKEDRNKSEMNPSRFASEEEMMRMMEQEMMENAHKDILKAKSVETLMGHCSFEKQIIGDPDNNKSLPFSPDQAKVKNQKVKETSLKEILQNNSPKVIVRQQQSSKSSTIHFQYQHETLRERDFREENGMKSKQDIVHPQMGTVIGDASGDRIPISKDKHPAVDRKQAPATEHKVQSPSLADVLKGSTGKQSRGRATSPPPRHAQQQRPPRSTSKAKSAFDNSFGSGARKKAVGDRGDPRQSHEFAYSRVSSPHITFESPPISGAYSSQNIPYPPPPPPPFNSYFHGQVYAEPQKSFEPVTFTPPRKHSSDSIPPPPRRRVIINTDPRSFNIRDTDAPRPFVGSQTVIDHNMPPSPPLQVEPPPRDEMHPPPQRPFEPAPFSQRQHHAVYNDKPPQSNQHIEQNASSSSPYNRINEFLNNVSNRGHDTTSKGKKHTPPDDINIKDDKVEVISLENENWSPFSNSGTRIDQRQKIKSRSDAVIDAEVESNHHSSMKDTKKAFNKWRGGPKPPYAADFSSTLQSEKSIKQESTVDAIKKAQELLANPKIRMIVARVQSNSKVQDAVQQCMGDARNFAHYLKDPEVGQILQELKDSIKS